MSTPNSNETNSSSVSESRPNNSGGQSLFTWAANRSTSNGPQKIRVTILCARSLVKRDLFRLPDPFVKVNTAKTFDIFSHVNNKKNANSFRFMSTGQANLTPQKHAKTHLIPSGMCITICLLGPTTL